MADQENQGKATVNPIQVQKFLSGLDYPAKKQQILDTAKQQGADENVMSTLQRIPDREYEGPTGITEEIGKFE